MARQKNREAEIREFGRDLELEFCLLNDNWEELAKYILENFDRRQR